MHKREFRLSMIMGVVISLLFIIAFAATSFRLIIDNKQVSSVLIKESNKKVYLALGDILKLNGFSVDWNSKFKKITAKKSKNVYEFYVNQKYYFYNKTKKTLSEKVILDKGKSYILGKDIASILQYSYSEDKSKKLIKLTTKKFASSQPQKLTSRGNVQRNVSESIHLTEIKYSIENDKFLLYIKTSSAASYKDYKLTKPDRIVIDVLNTVDNLNNNVININQRGILRVRHALNKTDKGEIFSRVVIDYDAMIVKSYKIQKKDNQLEVIVSLPININNNTNIDSSQIDNSQTNNNQLPSSDIPADNGQVINGNPYRVQKIDVKSSNNVSTITMDYSPIVGTEIYRVDDSFVVLKLQNAYIDTSNGTLYNVNDGVIDYFVVNNLDDKSMQVLFSTKAKFYLLNKLSNKIEIVFSDQYGTLKTDANGNLVLDSPFITNINYDYNVNTNVIKLRSKGALTISDDVHKLKDLNIITAIYSTYENDTNVISITINPEYVATVSTDNAHMIFGFSKKPQAKKKLKIFIDPGHGGSDPGAIYSKIVNGKKVSFNEKDLNLDISLRLKEKLKSMGYEVHMSRETDKFVDLYDRTKMANSLNADLFISIHNNATENSQTRGTMVLYNPNENPNNFISNKQFAQIVLDQIIKEVGTQNKGIMARPNLAVLRTSDMPAVLVEVAFGTNSADLELLLNDSFKENVAQAIANAVDYININFKK